MEKQILLKNLSQKFNIQLTDDNIEKFILYEQLIVEWNKKFNLTTILETEQIFIKHFFDSLLVLPYIKKDTKNIIDIGTGAGFPGIPLKILMPDVNFTLLDSTTKKISFLEEVVKTLNLKNITLISDRAEVLANNKTYREKFCVCVSRAVANLNILSELSIPFVKPSGSFIALKGPNIFLEYDNAKEKIKKLSGSYGEIKKVELAELDHYLFFVSKLSKTPTGYPRSMSKISNHPNG